MQNLLCNVIVEKFQTRKDLLSKIKYIENEVFRIFKKYLLVTARGLIGEYNSVDSVEKY